MHGGLQRIVRSACLDFCVVEISLIAATKSLKTPSQGSEKTDSLTPADEGNLPSNLTVTLSVDEEAEAGRKEGRFCSPRSLSVCWHVFQWNFDFSFVFYE